MKLESLAGLTDGDIEILNFISGGHCDKVENQLNTARNQMNCVLSAFCFSRLQSV